MFVFRSHLSLMGWSYAQERPGVRGEIVARIAGGERLAHICREAGMPCAESVTGWMRKDAAFAAEVAGARARARAAAAERTRRIGFDWDQAKTVLARLRAGETMRQVLGDPATPGARTLRAWRQAEAWFDAEMRAALRNVPRKPRRAFDAAIGEEIYLRLWKGERLRALLRSDRRYPSLTVFNRWRRENAEFGAMIAWVLSGWRVQRPKRFGGRYSAELAEEICELIVTGESLRSIARRPGMPCQRTLYAWVEKRPDFARDVAVACDWREDRYFDQITELASTGPRLSMREARKRTAPLMQQMIRLRKRPGWKRSS